MKSWSGKKLGGWGYYKDSSDFSDFSDHSEESE